MLKTTKQITLTGNAMIGDVTVVNLNATIPSDTGVGNINQYVYNSALYDANKSKVRADIAEFTALVYEIEDELAAETVVE